MSPCGSQLTTLWFQGAIGGRHIDRPGRAMSQARRTAPSQPLLPRSVVVMPPIVMPIPIAMRIVMVVPGVVVHPLHVRIGRVYGRPLVRL